ncbi:hypothetical protein EGW08_011635 [Elysia chlorotica]|uniref:SEFIR domain-containing protein n=1 Tax=Elysia chlorotica TaxID=188477 RepID=A0A433TGD8_ELYCH|nr:hypothetical protein EGW08_011635 [Elysia chlorotica]
MSPRAVASLGLMLAVIESMVMETATVPHVDTCEKEKDCSLQTDNIYLNCTVGHSAACRKAKEVIGKTEGSSHDLSLLPYISAIEIYDRPFSSRTVESLRFQFYIPGADIGASGISGVLVEFSEHEESNDNPWYSHKDPICRYFDFLNSSIPEKDVAASRMKITYDCIGLDIIPSTFVLRLQTVGLCISPPLVYVITWMHNIVYFHQDPPSGGGVWSHQLIAVAVVAPPGGNLSSLHVIFQPALHDIKFYTLTVITEPRQKDVQSKMLQANISIESIFFNNLAPGNYKIKVEALGFRCERDPSQCPPLFSSTVVIDHPVTDHGQSVPGKEDPQDDSQIKQEPGIRTSTAPTNYNASSEKPLNLRTVIGILSVLFMGLFVLISLCILMIKRQKHEVCCKLGWTKPEIVTIGVVSLADRSLEQQISRYFAQFLTETLGANVNLKMPFLSQNSPEVESCVTSTGSDDPLLHKPVWTTHSNEGKRSTSSTTPFIILDFYYGGQEIESCGSRNAASGEDNRTYPTKSWPRLSSELRKAIGSCGRENVLCVTFAHKVTPNLALSVKSSRYDHDDAVSSWTEGSKTCAAFSDITVSIVHKSTNDSVSLMNHLEPEGDQTGIYGVPTFFLPADTHKLYSKLTHRGSCEESDRILLDSEHSKSLNTALEVYRRASEQRSYTEAFVLVDSPSRSCSIETLSEKLFLGETCGSGEPN